MDSNASGYLLNHAALPSEYHLGKEDSNIIDLGLSLRVLQSETSYSSAQENYDELVDWHQLYPQKTTNLDAPNIKDSYDDKSEGIQIKQLWTCVKVNMDGVLVGKQSISGLRLFQAESRFSLFHKNTQDQWRMVGDVPWKEFVDRVKRPRIAYKDEDERVRSSSALLNSLWLKHARTSEDPSCNNIHKCLISYPLRTFSMY